MKAEEAKTIADEALDQLAAALSQGKSESLTQYLAAMSRFHDYSWGNVLLIISQKPDARQVAGFNTWKKLNRFVKKGEKGIVIIAPMLIKPKENERTEDGRDRESFLRFKAVYLFDVSQTDGDPLPEFATVTGDPTEYTDRLKTLISEKSIQLEYSTELGSAHGLSHGGKITIREGLTPAEEFSTLVHELAHEMLHKGDRRKATSKTIRETEAEAVAFVVSQSIGLQLNGAASDYIQLYDGDKETLAESLHLIQHAAADIISAVMYEAE